VIKDRIKDFRRVKASDLRPNPLNWRKHPDGQANALSAILGEIGFAGAILVRETDDGLEIIDGHLRQELIGAGEVPVLVTDLTAEESKLLLATYDPIAAMAEADSDILGELIKGIDTDNETLNDLLSGIGDDLGVDFGTEGQTDPDSVPDVDHDPLVEKGQLWLLGNHRLLCGDSTSEADVGRLMDGQKADMVFTDPPYGVSYAAKNEFLNAQDKGNKNQTPIKNDHLSEESIEEILVPAFKNLANNIAEYSSYYITLPSGDLFPAMIKFMEIAGLKYRHMLVWVKNNHVLGRCDYNYKHEPILYGWIKRHKFYNKGEQNKSVWNYNKPHSSKLHPTMKPVSLIKNAILNSSGNNQHVLDLFGGSGSTLIACEQTGRHCRMMELDEHYCDVIIERWQEFTGGEAVLEDGTTYNDLKAKS
jgi:DNA modification methylase